MLLLAGVFRALVVLVGVASVALTMVIMKSLVAPFTFFTVQSTAIVVVCFAVATWTTLRKRKGVSPAIKGAVTVYILITGLVFNLVLASMFKSGNHPPMPGGHQPPPPMMGSDNAKPPMPEMEGTPPQPPGPPNGDKAAPSPTPSQWASMLSSRIFKLSLFLPHTLLPLMVLIDWLVFDPHRRYRWRYAAIWLAYPLAYLGFLLIRHAIFPNTGYPYPFVDVNRIGYSGLAISVVIYGVAFYILGLIVVGMDRLLPSRENKYTQAAPGAECADQG